MPLSEWATKIASETQSAIQQDPGINYLTPIYDSMSLFAQQGIKAAGKQATVKIASYNGTPAVMELIKNGDIMAMDAGENIQWLAYATVDQVGRAAHRRADRSPTATSRRRCACSPRRTSPKQVTRRARPRVTAPRT